MLQTQAKGVISKAIIWIKGRLPESSIRNQWLSGILGGLIGGFIFVSIAALVTPYIHGVTGAAAIGWAAGMIITFFGIMAALLGLFISVVFAIQWIFLRDRVTGVLESETARMSDAIQGIGDFVLASLYSRDDDLDEERENAVKRAIKRYPEIPNAAAYMCKDYILRTNKIYVDSSGRICPIPIEIRERFISRAEEWANEALLAQNSHDPGYPNYVKACVLALRKEPRSAMEHLSKAFAKDDHFRLETLTNPRLWYAITGMTRGDKDEELLHKLLVALQLAMPTEETIKQLCDHQDDMRQASLDVISRENGDSSTITFLGVKQYPRDMELHWSILGPSPDQEVILGQSADSSLPLEHIFQKYIPIRIKEDASMMCPDHSQG